MVPKIDKDIGILGYSTSFPGIGGSIKNKQEDFIVSEALHKKSLEKINQDSGYAVYLLRKQGIDTNHALKQISHKTGLKLKALGLKDANAVTEQYACAINKSKSTDEFSSEKFSIKRIGFTQKPLSKKDMIGNRFEIKITDNNDDPSKFSEYEKILNYFGYQRFGSKRPVSHLIGRALVKRDFDLAVDLLLSFTSEYDSSPNSEIRQKLSDKSNYSKLFDEIPKQMDLERIVLSEMIKNDDAKSAFQALPITMRRFFVQAYQSFLFNLTLSHVLDAKTNLDCQDGDVCFDQDGNLGKFSGKQTQKLAIPLVGYSYYKKTRFDEQISKILDDEKISPKDFFIKEMQEVSSEGGFRNAVIDCNDIEVDGNVVKFTLSRGSFATIVMREIMKPSDPLNAGF
ncbi:MAG: tRNA pseudouridine(13) synthase TruD [Nitrosopumilaceae archaeon]|nr:tRNA pseudouridine(13) synthase TruD [Nitrosopumilaceae archaeon]